MLVYPIEIFVYSLSLIWQIIFLPFFLVEESLIFLYDTFLNLHLFCDTSDFMFQLDSPLSSWFHTLFSVCYLHTG